MPKVFKNPKNILIIILLFTAFSRLLRLDFPNAYVFDEVYHAFTAKEYVLGHKEAWEYFATPPKGVAYEWTHPPLAKETMAISLEIVHSMDAWAWRLPGVLLGILSVYLIYLLGKELFKSETAALLSAFTFSIEGLLFVQSRTGMNDIYVVTFMLLSLLLFLKNKYFFSSFMLGLALASKWSAIYFFPIIIILILFNYAVSKKLLLSTRSLIYFLIIPPILYLASYIPFFMWGFNWNDFQELQHQMWWYHTNLRATHDYASPWWSWPFNLYPVWYYVSYEGDKIGNIFASGNPIVFWVGFLSIIMTSWEMLKEFIMRSTFMNFLKKNISILIVLTGYYFFWLPWSVSPRIMFLYHYSPSVPFLSLALGYQLNKLTKDKKDRNTLIFLLVLMLLGFLFVYPFLTGIALPKNFMEWFFYTNITKNPFR